MMRVIVFIFGMAITSQCFAITESDVAHNIGKVALFHTALKQDWNGVPQLILTQSASRNATRYLKKEINRERPDGGNYSFPSGHTSRAFSAAWYVQERYGIAEAWPYFIAASWVAERRVDADRHHVSDVLGSVVLTYGMAKLFTGKDEPLVGIWYDDGLQVSIIKRF